MLVNQCWRGQKGAMKMRTVQSRRILRRLCEEQDKWGRCSKVQLSGLEEVCRTESQP